MGALQTTTDVIDNLRRDIANDVFSSGQKLVERELCDRYGVGRTAVRDALRFLSAEGIVTITENRGAAVARVQYAEALDVYQVRQELEALAGELFAVRGTPEEKMKFAASFKRVKTSFLGDDVQEILEANEAFYDHLLRGSRNRELHRIINLLHVRINQLRKISLASPNRSQSTTLELQRIVDAVLSGDPEESRRACADHVRQAANIALPSLMTAMSGDDEPSDIAQPSADRVSSLLR